MIEIGHLTTLQFWSFLAGCLLVFSAGIYIIVLSGKEKYEAKQKTLVDLGTGLSTLGTVLLGIVLAIS